MLNLHVNVKNIRVIPQNERVHLHNERNFPQAKLDIEINARFLLNGHGNLFFLLRIIIWLCLTRTGNYQIHEFGWLKSILTAA